MILSSDMTSFNFKLLHRLLPVKERLHQLSQPTSPTFSLCSDSINENLEHALLSCIYNAGCGQALLAVLQNHIPDLTYGRLLLLQFPDAEEPDEFPLVFFTSAY